MSGANVKKLFETARDIYGKKATGELTLTFDRGKRCIYFVNGEISYAQSEIEGERLGDFLVKYNLLTKEEVDAALSFANWEKIKLGEYLIKTGQLTSEEVEYAVLDVVNTIVTSPFSEEFLAINFKTENIKPESQTVISISTGDILINSVRNLKDISVFEEFYDKVKFLKPSNCAKSHDIYNHLRISPEEGFLYSRVDGNLTVEEIEKLTGFSSIKTARMLFGLTLLGIVEFSENVAFKESELSASKKQTKAEQIRQQTVKTPAVGRYAVASSKVTEKTVVSKTSMETSDKKDNCNILTEEEEQFVNEVKGLYESLDGISYYRLLGVDSNANGKEIKQAYMKMVKKFHPDKYAHKKFGNLGNILDKLFVEISTANSVLCDDVKRREYEINKLNITKVHEDSYFGRKKRILLDEAKTFFERGELEKAEKSVEKAISFDKFDPVLFVELGKIQMEYDDMAESAAKSFSKALKLDPALKEGYLYLARLSLKLGDSEKAAVHYNNLLSFDPDNVEAKRFLESRKNNGGVLGAMKSWFS
jgi:tetratricopeptide (TPR) repeat protein